MGICSQEEQEIDSEEDGSALMKSVWMHKPRLRRCEFPDAFSAQRGPQKETNVRDRSQHLSETQGPTRMHRL